MSERLVLACCDDDERRALVRAAPTNGLDYAEVGDDPRLLTVYFLGSPPEGLRAANLLVRGGERIRDIAVLDIDVQPSPDEDHDGWMVVRLDRAGDYSTYSLCVVALDDAGRPTDHPPPEFDPRYACVDFSFQAAGPTELDCRAPIVCPPPERVEPDLNYLAKDYASFRQLMLDRLALLLPDWRERHVPDLGITLVEVLAYVGDQLSYYQDAVATEAYLETARRRISVRRHVRLVDYALHEGCNARAWVTMQVSGGTVSLDPGDYYFVTHADGIPASMVHETELPVALPLPYTVFEPLLCAGEGARTFDEQHNAIRFHTWHGSRCCLPKGATAATLVDPGQAAPPPDGDGKGDRTAALATQGPPPGQHEPPPARYALQLAVCDVLVFEEIKGPNSGNPADASPAHRHAVRLTRVTQSIDPVIDPRTKAPTLVVEIEWAPEDALPFPLCLSSIGPDCQPILDVSVARGNVVLVDHGRSTCDPLDPTVPAVPVEPGCCDPCVAREEREEAGPYAPRLPHGDVTFCEPLPCCLLPPLRCGEGRRVNPASRLLVQDPRRAAPAVTLAGYPAAPDGDPAFGPDDLDDPEPLARRLAAAAKVTDERAAAAWLRSFVLPGDRPELDAWAATDPPAPLPTALRDEILAILRSLRTAWRAVPDLLASGADDRDFVVEIDDDRQATLRFGDGANGQRPDPRTTFRACYRTGNGTAGNVGAEAIVHVVFRRNFPSGLRLDVRNPLPARGGTAPERVEDAKMLAPFAFRQRLERAVTAEDYAAIVLRDFPGDVQRAAAQLRWTGHGVEILVAIDRLGSEDTDAVLLCRIERHLERYRRIGHDLRVVMAQAVAIALALTVRVRPGYLRGHVKAALLDLFSNRRLSDGHLGYFHPDNLTFGQSIDVSRIVAAAQAVPGVERVTVTVLERLFEGPNGEIAAGVLPIGPLEVARLDNDASLPEHGVLTITMEGGR